MKINPKPLLLIWVSFVFLCSSLAWGQYSGVTRVSSQHGTGGRPNIVIFCVDSMGYSDASCYGSEIKTPAIDKLAAEGIRLTNFYNCGSAIPSRASLLTGQYPHSAGIGHQLDNLGMAGYYGTLNKETPTLAEILKEKAGYETMMVGRWALSRDLGVKGPTYNWPTSRGFDQFYGTLTPSENQFNPSTLKMGDKPFAPSGREFYYTNGIAQVADEFLTQAAKSDKPFFLYVSLPGPFMPLQVPTPELSSQRGNYYAGWDEVRTARYRRMVPMHVIGPSVRLSVKDSTIPDWGNVGPQAKWQAIRMEIYAAQVIATDRAIGEIMQSVDQTGRGTNTMYIFLSACGASGVDIPVNFTNPRYVSEKTRNGSPVIIGNNPRVAPGTEKTYQSYGKPWANVSNTPFRGYADSVYEGGIASPCIIKYPGKIVSPGRVSHQIVHVIDIVPTILNVLELSYPSQIKGVPTPACPGVSFAPIFQMKTFNREMICWEYKGNVAAREGKWKLLGEYNKLGEDKRNWQLFDMEQDRAETKNLVSEYPSIAKHMYQSYVSWSKKNHVQSWSTVSEKLKAVKQQKAANIRR